MVTVTCSFFLNYFLIEWDVTYQMNIVDSLFKYVLCNFYGRFSFILHFYFHFPLIWKK